MFYWSLCFSMVVVCSARFQNNDCGPGEEYQECGTACPKTCDNHRKNMACTLQCVRGCFCEGGLVRNKNKECIPPEQCPTDNTQICKKDEEYYDCVPGCTNTCENYGIQDRILCAAVCKKGCFCKKGLVKRKDGKCVDYEQCPIDVCPENEIPRNCASPCNTCEEKGDCVYKDCGPGCDCKKGYYRNEDGKCIPEDQCPRKKCGQNEEYKECGIACPKSCNNLRIKFKCVDKCVEGCFCKPGFVRSENGKCIRPEECPSDVCPTNEEPTSCVPRCETCDNPGEDCEIFACNVGCKCQKGYLRNSEGKCIPQTECPEPCDGNEVPTDCVDICNTCENKRKNASCAFFACNPGCNCRPNFTRNAKGKCISISRCLARRQRRAYHE